MRKILSNIVCSFVPGKTRRNKIRKYLSKNIFRDGNCLKADISNLTVKIDDIDKLLGHLYDDIYSTSNSIPKELQEGLNLNDLYPFEIHACVDRWIEDFLKIDLKTAYPALVQGMDDESILIISRSIRKLRLEMTKNKGKNFIFPDEKNSILNIERNFYPVITKLSENCFSYGEYLLPINHFEVPVFWNKLHMGMIYNIDYLKDKDIIDAGAFVGDSALVLSKYTEGNVYAFEPTRQSYELMLETIKMNNRKNIVPVKKGIGAEDSVEIANIFSSGSSAKFDIGTGEKEEIELTSIDKYVEENELNVGLIKSDVEGFEQELLRGAIKTIFDKRPILLISIYHTMDDFFYIKPLIDSWNLGYKFRVAKPIMGQILLETLLVAEVR